MSNTNWRSKWSKSFQNIINQGRRVKIFERLRNGPSPDGWVGGYSRTPSTTVGDRDYTQSTCSTSTSLDSAFNSTISTRSITKDPIALQNMPTNYQKNNNNNNEQDYIEEQFNHPLLNANEPSPDEISNVFPSIPLSPSSVDSSPSLGVRKHNFTIIPMKHDPNERLDLKISKQQGNEALGLILSALYGKLLVVMGIAFPMSEVISTYIPPSFYDGFYLYLYFGSIMFMICVYGNVLRHKATRSVRSTFQRINSMRFRQTNRDGIVAPDVTPVDKISIGSNSSESSPIPSPIIRPNVLNLNNHFETINNNISCSAHSESSYAVYGHERIHYGSFYLRMGAVAFGVGSMIYSGLEFGQYFELEPDTKCHNFMIALTPAVRMIFTFMQMYFIFLNSKLAESKVKLGAQFGLMHMIGTNLCVWLSVLVQETRHEILHFYNPDNHTITLPKFSWGNNFEGFDLSLGNETSTIKLNVNDSSSFDEVFSTVATAILSHDIENNSHRVKRGLKGPHSIYECRRTDIIGSLVQNASPFLFPCTIEYSLICAAILYVMWKNMAKQRAERHLSTNHNHNGDINMNKRSPHYYSVDCSRANKGLFFGILILVMTIISLIIFFVFINRPGNQYKKLAVVAVNITEIILYSISTVAVLIGMFQIRELKYSHSRNLELDNILLVVAQTGSFIYNVFTIIGGHFTMKKNTVLVLFTGLASLVQLLFQTIYILDASKRSATTPEQARRKPGREIVTFLLVTNLAMWSINTLEKSRADSHPVQLNFYGVWAWTIITHISMPLAIFYRFHSTVCLCEIWKKAYKVKSPS